MCSKILDLKAHGVAKLLRYFPQISDTPEAVHIVILVEEMSFVVWLSICIGTVPANMLHTSSSPGLSMANVNVE